MSDYPPPPKLDPSTWWDYAVFRETFLADVDGREEVETIRRFGKIFNSMAHEGLGHSWNGTFAEAKAHGLRAALADLRHLQGYLGSELFRFEEQHNPTPRNQRWCKVAIRLSKRLGALADELENELIAGLVKADE